MNNDLIDVKKLRPFTRFCMTIGELPSSYLVSMTYEEQLIWFCNYLEKTVIPTVNNNGEAVTELQNLYIELKSYVDNYFENLDVQEEVNNKLDEMALDGTLEELIGQYVNDKVQLIFPKFWANALSGDCNLIKYANKSIMIDTYNSDMWSNVRTMLLDHDISSLDYLIITHYHGDHYGNLENLITYNYVNSNTVVYLPADTTYLDGTNGTENVNERITQVKSLLEGNNIEYIVPNENDKLEISNLKIIFYNCDANALKTYYYDNGIKDYNQYSTVNLILHKNMKYLYAGDGGPSTYQRLIDTNFITGRIDFFKLGHHGHNTSTNVKFMDLIQPQYTIQTCGITDFIRTNYSVTNDTSLLKTDDSKIYPTNMQPDYLTFIDDGDHINCLKGYEYCLSNTLETRHLYVNKLANTSNIQDGSQSHPFTEVMQAIGIIKTFPQYNYYIHIAAGEYGIAHPSDIVKNRISITTGKSSLVRLIGEGETPESVTLSSIVINNSSVILQNLSVDVDNITTSSAIASYNSNVVFNDVVIKSQTGTLKDNTTGLDGNWNSNLKINSLSINNVKDGIKVTHSTLNAYSITFGDNITNSLFTPYNSNVTTNNITVSDSTQNASYINNYKQVKSPQVIFSSTSGATSDINFTKSVTLFDWIEIYYTTDNGIKGNTGRIFNLVGNMVGLAAFYTHSGGTTYNKQCNCGIAADHLTLSQPKQITISSSGCSSSDMSNAIKVLKVIGGFNDY